MNRESFVEKLNSHTRPVIVDIWAPWCTPCRTMEPSLKRLESDYAGRVDVWRINADEHPELVTNLGVRGIPTLIVYQSGVELTRRTGSQSHFSLNQLFESALAGEAPASKGLAQTERLLRGLVGLSLILIGWLTGPSWLVLVAGLLVSFSAVHDRCPLWRAISSWVKDSFRNPTRSAMK